MIGPIKRLKNYLGLNPKKHISKKPRRKTPAGVNYRDYRGIEGVLEDAHGRKKK